MMPMAMQAGGTLLGGFLGARGARAQERAARRAQELIQAQYQQTRGDMQPYTQAGTNALGRLEAVNSGDYSSFENSPDYLYARDQSMRALDRSAAARGSLYSGGADADRLEMASGLASQNLNNYTNRLGQLSNMGLSATTSLGQFGANAASGQAGAINAQGQAQANRYQAWQDTVNGMGQVAGNHYGSKPGKAGGAEMTQPFGFGGTGGIGAGLSGGSRWGGGW